MRAGWILYRFSHLGVAVMDDDDIIIDDMEDTNLIDMETGQPLVREGQGRSAEDLTRDAMQSGILMACVLALGLVLALVKGCGHG